MKLTMMKSLVLGMGLTAAATSFGQGAVPPGGAVTIDNVKWGGSGCTQLDTSYQITTDKTQFTLLFDNYVAEKNGGSALARANCNVTMTLNVPAGWSYSLVSAEYAGYYFLEPGVIAEQASEYQFIDPSTMGRKITFKSTVAGGTSGKDGTYNYTDRIGVEASVWSDCKVKRPLLINTSLILKGRPAGYGYISMDRLSGAVDTKAYQRYYLWWKRCP